MIKLQFMMVLRIKFGIGGGVCGIVFIGANKNSNRKSSVFEKLIYPIVIIFNVAMVKNGTVHRIGVEQLPFS